MGANTQGRERLLLFKDEVSVAVLPVENGMRKLPALIQSCKLENTLWSRIAVPSLWEKSKYNTQYLRASLNIVGFCLLTRLTCLGLAQHPVGEFCFPNAVVGAAQPYLWVCLQRICASGDSPCSWFKLLPRNVKQQKLWRNYVENSKIIFDFV